jgi:hypothetical protein
LYPDKTTNKDRVDKDLDELTELKALGICEKTIYLVADAHYHEKNQKKWNAIKERLPKQKEKRKIDYLDLVIMCDKKNCEEEIRFKFQLEQ